MTADVLAHYWTQAKHDLEVQAANPFPKQSPCTGADIPLAAAAVQLFPSAPGCSRGSSWPASAKW
jgi:hypothetical protein